MNDLPFFDKIWEVEDAVKTATDMRQCLRKIKAHLADDEVRRRFFEILDAPEWIDPLAEAGFFSHPPSVLRYDGNRPVFERWPASQFLGRLARDAPKRIAEILSTVETDNPNILADMIEAGLKMPPRVAAPLAGRIASLLGQGVELYMFRQKAFCQLVERLAGESSTQEDAFGLAKAYLFPRVKPKSRTQRREEHNFLRALESLVPMTVCLRPEETIRLLCDTLVAAIRAKGEPASGDPMFDYSYMWRPAIEEHEENRPYESAGRLVTPLRNAAEIAIRENHVSLQNVLGIVRDFKYLIFRRLGVHLINVFADAEQGLARQRMMDKELFDNYRFKHEYAMLVGKHFALLTPTERDRFFGWIDEGPDMSRFDDRVRSNLGREPTEEDRGNRKKHWQYERLWWIRGHLDGKWKQLFDEMYAASGEPELADLNVRLTSHWGSESPIESKDLQGLSLEEVLHKVVSWRPDREKRGETLAEGLQDTFGAYVKENLAPCSRDAKLMMGKPAMFVRPFIAAMCDALNESKKIELEPVFELCSWVVKQPREQDTRPFPTDEHDLVDRDWEWCRNRTGDFVAKCCEKEIPYTEGNRAALWSIVAPLTHDPDTNYIVDQKEEDVRTRSFIDHSINNPRGKAMHALFKYARWVDNHSKEKRDRREIVPGGFDSMPEVRNALEKGLAEGEHDSFAVRAAYGWHLGVLYWIGKDWLASQVDQLFDLEKIETDPPRAYGWAAWNGFLVCIPPHIEYFKLLEKQFKYAVDQYQTLDMKEVTHGSPAARLGEHLIVLYGRGQLGLDDQDSLLRRFLSRSCQSVRSYAISFVGRSLHREEDESKETFPKEVIDRFVKLWEWYWPEVGSRDEQPSRDLFSYWYTSRCFERRWALAKLWDYVQRVSLPEPEYRVPERLAEDAGESPETALSIMEKMIEADKEGWRIDEWQESIERILACALKGDDPTRSKATDLINRLGRRGYLSLGQLLR